MTLSQEKGVKKALLHKDLKDSTLLISTEFK